MDSQVDAVPSTSIIANSPPRSKPSPKRTLSDLSPYRSGFKPRLLWRNDLVLQDGTHVPGVAFVSYQNPFSSIPAHNAEGLDELDHPARVGQEEAEADLCLALEMMRNKPLRISSIITESRSVDAATSSMSKTQSIQPSQSTSQAHLTDRPAHYISSGQVRVYIDPTEHSSVALFKRLFCPYPDLVVDAGQERSATIIAVSLGSSGTLDDDVFGSTTAVGQHSELVIFAQLVDADSDKFLLRLVIGRKVTVMPKKAALVSKGFERTRSFQRQNSVGSQSLQDVFSQAGIRMSHYGALSGPLRTPRPDDPLPRGSITALLQARSKRRSNGSESARSGLESPVIKIETNDDDVFGEDIKTKVPQQGKRRRLSDQKVAGSPDAPPPISSNQAELKVESIPTPKFESLTPEPLVKCEDTERCNRGAIKKAVHSILVQQYKLTKTHADYVACYNQTCSGVWCTFRNTASNIKLDKTAIDNVARMHLSLYLDQAFA